MFGPELDRLHEVSYRGDGAAADPQVIETSEGAFDEVAPRRRRRSEVQVPPGVFRIGKPASDRRCLVGGEVVEHGVDLEVTRHMEVDEVEVAQHVDGPLPCLQS